MTFTNIAVIGAGGALGKLLIKELLASSQPEFQITAIARASSNYSAPSERIKVFKQDLMDHAGMVSTLRTSGAEAIVMTQGVDQDLLPVSKAIIEAAIEAGVKMVMPSDYGSDDTPTFVKVYTEKPQIRTFIEERAKEGKITYTLIKNGPFFDMPLQMVYGIDPKAKTARLLDDGLQRFHSTYMSSVARAIVGVLRSPSQFSNKLIHIHNVSTTQRELLDIVEAETGGVPYSVHNVDTEELKKNSIAGLEKGELSPQNTFGAIMAAVWGKEGAADWDVNDESSAVGLGGMDLRTEIKKKLESRV